MKANAPKAKTAHGRLLTPKKRKEAVPRAPTRIRTLAIPKGDLEKEADQKEGGSPRSGGKHKAKTWNLAEWHKGPTSLPRLHKGQV